MSGIDLTNVLISIVISLAVAHLLGGIGRIMRAPQVKFSILQGAWVAFLLVECVNFWVSSALTHLPSVTYPQVLRAFFSSAGLYLACWMILPDETPKEPIDLGAFFDANRRKFLGVLVIYNAMIGINMMNSPWVATGSWTAWLGTAAVAAAWIWPARAVQYLAVAVLLTMQTTYEMQFTWKF
jgi:hypothetical protein